MTGLAPLTADQRCGWENDGYFVVPGFGRAEMLHEMIERIIELARRLDAGEQRPDLLVSPEAVLADAVTPEGRLSKIFRIMRSEDVFRDFATDPRLLAMLAEIIGPDVDCFLSQFIFKQPGALGQPWHQDEWYFRMDPPKQVGVWLACTDATAENGPLWVVPGSHRERVHEDVINDPRPGANLGYVEIQGADTSREQQMLLRAGDLLVFDCHLRHRSTDNVSDGMRAAMVYHYSPSATAIGHDLTFNQDWVGVLRDGAPVPVDPTPVAINWGSSPERK